MGFRLPSEPHLSTVGKLTNLRALLRNPFNPRMFADGKKHLPRN